VSCAAFKDSVAAYALGALEADERRACDAHLAEPIAHDGCREALADALESAAALGAALPPMPPGDGVWRAIEREIGAAPAAPAGAATSRALPPASPPASRPASAPRRGARRELVAWTLAVAASVLAFVLGMEYRASERRLATLDRELASASSAERDRQICLRQLATARVSLREKEAALALLVDPGTQLVQLAAQGDEPYHASALLNPARTSAMILARDLAPQQGKDYQLWLIRGDEKIPAGILRASPEGATLARIGEDVLRGGRPDAFAVTVEPQGGMPQPTGPIVLLGKVPSA
jgi:anti-sigma-K factor RskA